MILKKNCSYCHVFLSDTYIECFLCKIPICLDCFAQGLETKNHRNDHLYQVHSKNTFFEEKWTVNMEKDLLNAMTIYGYGNWEEICKNMSLKYENLTPSVIHEHYDHHYLNFPSQNLPEMPLQPSVPLTSMTSYIRDDDSIFKTEPLLEMVGYSALRNDFTIEYKDTAEFNILNMTDDESDMDEGLSEFEKSDDCVQNRNTCKVEVNENTMDDKFDGNIMGGRFDEPTSLHDLKSLGTQFKLAVIDIYRRVLKERQNRKRKILMFGLMNMSKELVMLRRYEQTIGRDLVKWAKVLKSSALSLHLCLESLYLQKRRCKEIETLRGMREKGISWLKEASLYNNIKSLRRSHMSKFSSLSSFLYYITNDTRLKVSSDQYNLVTSLCANVKLPKRTLNPLDISETPGVEQLTNAEKELCSKVRILPSKYIDFRRILMNESEKVGHLRLATARNLIKIDVNKTRKIFDFLAENQLIQSQEPKRKKRTMNQ